MVHITRSVYKEAKKQFLEEIYQSLREDNRAIVRGLGTFKIVRHKAKVNNLGKIPARNLVKFSATIELRKWVNKK